MLQFDGGKVKRTLERVITPIRPVDPALDDNRDRLDDKNIKTLDAPERTDLERVIDDAFNERDRIAGDLLDLDDKFDALQNAINDQLKGMDIPVTNRNLREAVKAFGGDDSITYPVYRKAKKTAEAISTAMGVNPLHIPFAKKTPFGKSLTQYAGDILRNCADMDFENFPTKQVYKKEKEQDVPFLPKDNTDELDGVGRAGKNEDNSLLTTVEDLLGKAKIDMKNFLIYELFWNKIWNKFLAMIITLPFKTYATLLKPWTTKKIIGKFVSKIYCMLIKIIDLFLNIQIKLGFKRPEIGGDPNTTKALKEEESFEEDEEKKEKKPNRNERPFKSEGINITRKEAEDCSEELTQEEIGPRVNRNDPPIDKKKKTTEDIVRCLTDQTTGGEVIIPDTNATVKENVAVDDCAFGKVRLLVEELANSVDTPLNTKTPFQEGWIPPECYEHATTVLSAVRNDAINGNPDNKYNSTAVLFDPLVGDPILRDYHELSKFMMTVQDNSEGSKQLRNNTMKNPRYNQIFMNKDVEDFRDKILNKERK